MNSIIPFLLFILLSTFVRGTPPFGKQQSSEGIKHSFLISGSHTVLVGEEGQIKWQIPGKSRDAFVLKNGNILVSIALGKEKLKSYLDISDVLLIDEAECFIRPVSNALPNSQFKATPLRLPGCYGGCIAVLNVFANKTYAPATELSRSAGAGADSIDDD